MDIRKRAAEELHKARQITDTAKAQGRQLTPAEAKTVDAAIEVAKTAAKVKAMDGTGAHGWDSADPNGRFGAAGWGATAKAIVAGKTRVEGRSIDFIGRKGLTATDIATDSILQDKGIRPFFEDGRSLYGLFRAIDPENELHVSEYSITARSAAAGVERDPTSTSAKAETSVTVAATSGDMKQFASIISDVPQALLDAEPQLESALRSSLGRELALALDAHVLSTIDGAVPTAGTSGADVFAKLAKARTAVIQAGGNPTVGIISDTDVEALALLTADETPAGYDSATGRFMGLALMSHPSVVDSGYVLDPEKLGVLYLGRADVLIDPFTSMDTNEVRIRMEHLGLMVVREAAAGAKFDYSPLT